MIIFRRLTDFLDRCQWVGRYFRFPVLAPVYLVVRKKFPAVGFPGVYGKFPIRIRGTDLSALREILRDREYEFLAPVLKSSSSPLILDIGAHIGLFALWVFETNPSARVVSVEASPATYPALLKNRNLSNIPDSQWQCLNRAAWKNEEGISFLTNPDSLSHRIDKQGQEKVAGVTLRALVDSAAPAGQKIDLMKVDIEGAEEAFLCDGDGDLSRVERLVIELHAQHCNADRVRQVINRAFPIVETLSGRSSSKEVLFCRKR